ncbi:aminotransferase class I/II-fold pyridoxal phosphate-dependent enzyme [Leptospira ognonensis]|uniref:Aminotransferase n=1 Tax=Leptospira ognonensis TaxID=2484945 RepID=A0A4R9K082_9LEPT|nr:aminotransferase class I/II-fold pyridoxal phosphate-dependent enzyme [Leptospira ognonensis]TGL58092.1 aminotransferase class I/II-fold pyridoxal phosphate-dependent enzyme [Leptospira ognonensis]
MEPRQFFIEERLELYRNHCQCNLGESGYHAFTLGEVMDLAQVTVEDLREIPLYDSPNQGREDLRAEIASLYPGVSANEVLISTGTSEAIYLLFHLLLEEHSRVALYVPAFQALYEIPKMLGATIIPVPINASLQAQDWMKVDADLFVINHPHNPTGLDFAPEEQTKLIELLKTKNKPVLFDEHYRFLDRKNELGWSGVSPKERFFGTGSFTKCFGVTGLRVGWLIADETTIARARSFKDYLTHTVSPISELLALKLMQNRKQFLQKIRTEVENNILYFQSRLSELKDILSLNEIHGGLVSFLKLREGLTSESYADQLFQKTGVFVLPGKNFEREGFLRIGYGESHEKFKWGINEWIKFSHKT